jgi:DNA modification methylase
MYDLHHGEALAVLRTLPTASVDAIVADPPAGIGFMGKNWDKNRGGRDQWIAWLAEILAEARRVLKPGHHAAIWALPRTSHWTGIAIEDAGFEVRDRVGHLFGSGMPKSKHHLKPAMEDWWIARNQGGPRSTLNIAELHIPTNDDRDRIGGGTKGKGKVYGDSGTYDYHSHPEGRWPPHLVLSHTPECVCVGTTQVKVGPAGPPTRTTDTSERYFQQAGGGYTTKGRSTVSHAGADGTETVEVWECAPWCPVAQIDQQSGERKSGGSMHERSVARGVAAIQNSPSPGRNVKREPDSGGASRYFTRLEMGDEVPFLYAPKASPSERNRDLEDLPRTTGGERPLAISQWEGQTNGSGKVMGASAPQPNSHPTVKSLALMRWLCQLVTPEGGIVLDPFMGSGSTGVAALELGYGFIGIEREAEYMPIARARIVKAAQRLRRGGNP